MRKFVMAAAVIALVACGDKAAEQAAADSARVADSVRVADSTAAAMKKGGK